MPRKKKPKKAKGKSFFNNIPFKIVAVALVICCTAISVSTEYDRMQKEEELLSIQEKIKDYENENAELQRNLEGDDMTAYIEKVAREDFNYAYPDEQRFYDTSRN
ncbi:MAG: septum formation initiator family protein [Ruminococcus sp.]